jgi:hypothetical protein
MKDYHINIFYSEDDEGYIADIPDLIHCSAFGETPEEALSEVMKAKQRSKLGLSQPIQTGSLYLNPTIVRSFTRLLNHRAHNQSFHSKSG